MLHARLPRRLPAVLALALLAACAQSPHEAAESVGSDAAPAPASPAEAAAGAARLQSDAAAPGDDAVVRPEAPPSPQQMVSAIASQDDPARRFIRTAQVQFQVDDVYRSALAIEDLVAAQGGFVVGNRIRTDTLRVRRRPMGEGKQLELTEYVTRGELSVRVPSDRAQAFLRELAGQMRVLDGRDFSAHDAQFDLLRQQLAYQRGQALQASLGDAVQAGDRLDRKAEAYAARAQALAARDEALVAQREFEDRVAFATISLSLQQAPQVRSAERVDVEAVFAQHSPGFFARLGSALGSGWYGLLDTLVALALLWPLWLAAAVAAIALRSWRRARRAVKPG